MKEYVLPVFEDISFHTKKVRLHDYFPVYTLKPAQRLKEIVMRDFKIIPPHLKKLALEKYFLLTNDKKILHAFETGYLKNLTAVANSLLQQECNYGYAEQEVVCEKLNIKNKFNSSLQYYFLTYGITSDIRKVKASREKTQYVGLILENNNYAVDALGIATLLKFSAS